MAVLRIVRERRSYQSHEADLRGLGDDAVLKEVSPIPVLTIACEAELAPEIESLISTLASDLSAVTTGLGLHISKAEGHRKDYKVDAVDLFSTWLAFVNGPLRDKDIASHLWLSNPMHFHLQKDKPLQHSPLDSYEGAIWDAKMKVDYPLCANLKQSGFKLHSSRHGTTLSNADSDRLWEELKSELVVETVVQRRFK